MSFDNIAVTLILSLSLLYFFRHIRRELSAARKGKCGGCPLSDACSVKSGTKDKCRVEIGNIESPL